MIHPARGQSGRRQVGLTAGFLLLALLGSLALLLTCSAWRSGPASGTVAASCPQFCIDCPNQVCQGCSDGRYLHMADSANPCVVTCPPDYPTIYDNMGVLICFPESIEGCSMMRLSDDFYCVECKPGRWISEGTCPTCPAGCAACQDPSHCTSCSANWFAHQGACVEACPSGTFPSGLTCVPCPGGCSLCSDASTCSACEPGSFLSGSSCGPTCPTGTFANGANNTCTNCPANCLACTGADSCTACTGAWLLHRGGCVTACPDGFFARDGSCMACSSNCTTCTDDTLCTVCAPGYPLHEARCMAEGCPGGLFDDEGKCSACMAGCDTCVEAAVCDTCAADKVKYQGQCLSACPAGTFPAAAPGDLERTACLECHPLCAECAGPGADQCTACEGSLTIQQPIPPVDPPLAEGMCVPDCMNDPSQCVECEPGCDLCRRMPDESTFCMVCQPPGLALDGLCVGACPPGYATMTAAGYCARCSGSCGDACFGPGSNQCLNCPAGKLLQAGTCRDACTATGWFQSSPTTCDRCHASCSQCAGPDEADCTACPRGSFRLAANGGLGHRCVTSCPGGQYGDVLQGECRACHQECASCSGATAGDCLSCHAGKLLFNLTCVDSCPVGHYATADGTQCNSCGVGCAECAPGTGLCTLCKVGQYADYAAGVCYSACPGRFLADEQAKTCTPCAGPCSSCAGSVDTCTACQDPAHRLRASTGECVAACDSHEAELPGTGPQAGSVLCMPCHESCESCHSPGSDTACSSCSPGTFLSSQGACVSDCPAGSFSREADRQCEACDASCHTCEGPTEAQCLSCAGKTGALLDGHCLSSCPLVGFWLDESDPLHRVCRPCGEGCDRCSDATSCLTCKPGLVLLHSGPGGASCVSDCPGGFFASLLDGQSQAACAACAPDCLTCTGPERRDCQVYACETDGTCGPPRNRSLVIGLAVGLSLLLLILLLILLVLLWALRRRRRVPKEEADTDMTVLNTVMDLSLPGFLLLSFQEDLRVTGDAASSGTQGGIFPAEPLKPELITAAGDSSIVVKLLSAEPSPSLAEAHVQAMFENELSILWALQQSPNVVRMLGYTQAPRAIVMVREATDLDSLLGSGSPLDAANALALVRGMALGLGFIHAQGIAHRDIKSANVLVGPCPETGAMRPAFADFGVAMAVSRGSALLDSAMVLACSVSFAAPEVLASMDAGGLGAAPIDHLAADVYSLASVFWHILTQTRPWSGLSKDRIQDLLGSGRTPASHGPAAREDLLQEPALGSLASGLLADMWATDPGRRPGISSVAMSLSE